MSDEEKRMEDERRREDVRKEIEANRNKINKNYREKVGPFTKDTITKFVNAIKEEKNIDNKGNIVDEKRKQKSKYERDHFYYFGTIMFHNRLGFLRQFVDKNVLDEIIKEQPVKEMVAKRI